MTALDQVDILAEQFKKLLPMKQEDEQRLDKKFRLEFNYNSNHIEGNTLTYGETELLLIFDDTKGNHTMREYEEMKAHDVAYQMVEELAMDKERPLNEQIIKNLNEIILVRPFWKDAITQDGQHTRRQIKVGDYKEYPNSVRLQNGEIFEYASPAETPIQMQELIDWYRAEENQIHPVTLAAMLHYKFVRIHPFDDGNGRVSRLLMNYVLLRNGLPPVIIKSEDKVNYLRALNRADIGDYEAFIEYIAEEVVWSLELSVKAAKGESVDEIGDFAKEIKLLSQKAANLDLTKSPKLVYTVFGHLKESVWTKITETLKQLDVLFTDSKTNYYVNGMEESFPTRSTFNPGIFERISTKPSNPKIFGHDIYDTDIFSIQWMNTKYGLKGSNNQREFTTNLKVSFDTATYNIELSANQKLLYKVDKKYDDLLFTDTADKMNELLGRYALDEISKRIQRDEK